MKNLITLVILFLLSNVAIAGQGVTCFDYRNIPVQEIATPQINDIAQAHTINGMPVILYNPNIVNAVARQTQTFFFWHECAHHTLAHTVRNIPFSREQEADCWAIKGLVSINAFSNYDFQVLQSQLAALGTGDWTHLPGPARAINLYSCLQ